MARPGVKGRQKAKRRAARFEQSDGSPKRPRTSAERSRAYRERCRATAPGLSRNDLSDSTAAASAEFPLSSSLPVNESAILTDGAQSIVLEPRRSPQYMQSWERATRRFKQVFLENDFGHECNVCDRLWFVRDLKAVDAEIATFLSGRFSDENTAEFKLCANCFKSCKSQRMPDLSRSHGYKYPPKPTDLPDLDPLTERLVSPRFPFLQIRRLRHGGNYGIVGQIINVPVDVDTMVKSLPRALDDDKAFNVNLKRNVIHKSSYLSGFVKKSTVHKWLRFLVKQPLYEHYNISIDWSVFRNSMQGEDPPEIISGGDIETLDVENSPESTLIHSMQQSLLFDEAQSLHLAPGQNRSPESLLFDKFAEELSFPSIYYGVPREIRSNDGHAVRATPYSMATSEIRRKDRRGATPQHVLYMVMRVLRFRMRDSIQNMFRCLRTTENITWDQVRDRQFVSSMIDNNQAFLKSIPNSLQYWAARKKDLFAMIRQLGKPTAFLTLSANETRWPHLLRVLYRLSDKFKNMGDDIPESQVFEKLDQYKRAYLVAEDPVTCSIYFHKLVKTILAILASTSASNPFRNYRVVDYFLRFEFQQRGSAHSHIILWLENDPKEKLSENMPQTISMITDLCSVTEDDLRDQDMIKNQTHVHTFTCTKRGEQSCRFNIPFWPMLRTTILLPLDKEDQRRVLLKKKVESAREKLQTKAYDSVQEYLRDIDCDYEQYLELVRSHLKRATILFKRDMTQIFINTFNPWIASVLNSNMDLQIILDVYSCAAYVIDYVNKSERGISQLHRELTKIHEANPEFDEAQIMSALGLKVLNSVEICAQEAAWILLHLPMSRASRNVVVIPTVRPHERYKQCKRKSAIEAENLAGNSTDIWTKNLIQKYEERHVSIEHMTLAQFTAWIGPPRTVNNEVEDVEDSGTEDEREETAEEHPVQRRKICRIIRYRNYDSEDILDHMREMVTLHIPFRNEHSDVIDRDKYVDIYEARQGEILERRKEFEADIDMDAIFREVEQIRLREQNDSIATSEEEHTPRSVEIAPNDDDLNEYVSPVSAIRPRSNVMSKEKYCEMLRTASPEQLELVLEVIHRIHEMGSGERKPIQIFLTGPAGSGKSFTLKLLMETYNRYSQHHNCLNNAYIATATTGKAAVAIGGVTVHSAFRLTLSRQTKPLSAETLHTYRYLLRNVKCVIIDEISMCGSHTFHSVNSRLQAMTGEYESPFGGLDFFACGDLKQLSPVNATPVYCATRDSLGGRAILWQALDYFPLRKVMRQSDTEFSSALTKIGCGTQLSEQERSMIQDRFRTRQWCDDNLPRDFIRLYHSNTEVQTYNESVLSTSQEVERNTAADTYTGYTTEKERRDAIGSVHRKKYQDTGSLPYTITLATGYPYMLTVNVNVEDGLVNGAIGKLRYIEDCPTEQHNIPLRRIWLEFDTEYIGRLTRVRYRAHIRCKPGVLRENWVPIELRTANIKVNSRINCNRRQFPLLPACALTIHKSQGGTFDHIVYDYHKSHSQQLVYVALSRVTSLEGLYITNLSDDLTFYHARQSTAPTIRQVQNEYRRLESHRLPTVTTAIEAFLAPDRTDSLIILNMNVQSLAAHAKDVTGDGVLTQADILVLTETWLHKTSQPINLEGFRLEHHGPCENRSGGVAIFKRENGPNSHLVIHSADDSSQIDPAAQLGTHAGDLISTVIYPVSGSPIILVAIYVHQNTPYGSVECFLEKSLAPHDNPTRSPMILMGDFNVTQVDREKLQNFLKQRFALQQTTGDNDQTTLGGTCIDLTFSRGLNSTCKSYISYFSYHRPVFNKIKLNS